MQCHTCKVMCVGRGGEERVRWLLVGGVASEGAIGLFLDQVYGPLHLISTTAQRRLLERVIYKLCEICNP